MAEVANELEGLISNNHGDVKPHGSSSTFTRETPELHDVTSSSSYVLASEESQGNVLTRWRGAGMVTTENAGVQPSRAPLVQRSTLVNSASLDSTGMWYILALMLPLFSFNNPTWRCTSNTILGTAELLLTHLSAVCTRARTHFRRLAQDQVAREIFATAMDIVLVVYAIGFLFLSMYQASVFG